MKPICDNKGQIQRYVPSDKRWHKINVNTPIVTGVPWMLHFDGSCPGNGLPKGRTNTTTGPCKGQKGDTVMGIGFILQKDGKSSDSMEEYIPLPFSGTSNQAEYMALIEGLRMAHRLYIRTIDVVGDSLLIVNQVQDIWKVKAKHLRKYHEEVKALLNLFHSYTIHHIPREDNEIADELAAQASIMALEWREKGYEAVTASDDWQEAGRGRATVPRSVAAMIRYWALKVKPRPSSYTIARIWGMSEGQTWNIMERRVHQCLVEEDLPYPPPLEDSVGIDTQ